jgi:hypothetical protein
MFISHQASSGVKYLPSLLPPGWAFPLSGYPFPRPRHDQSAIINRQESTPNALQSPFTMIPPTSLEPPPIASTLRCPPGRSRANGTDESSGATEAEHHQEEHQPSRWLATLRDRQERPCHCSRVVSADFVLDDLVCTGTGNARVDRAQVAPTTEKCHSALLHLLQGSAAAAALFMTTRAWRGWCRGSSALRVVSLCRPSADAGVTYRLGER